VLSPVLRALVTGASAGLGECFARRLADRGVDLVLVARREAPLRALADELPVDVEVLTADLADREDLAAVEERLARDEEPVDLLVNNAGFGAFGEVAGLDTDRLTEMVDVNVTALVRLTRAALPVLIERGRGGIINVGSTAGFQPNPHSAVYGASKAFVRSFTEAVHEELRGRPVHVMLLAPGVTATEFQSVAGVAEGAVPAVATMRAQPVVDTALNAFASGDAVCVPGLANRVSAFGSQLIPSAVTRRASDVLHRRYVGGA
jgi:uncharacterized protein